MKTNECCSINRARTLVAFLLVMMPGAALAASPEWRPTYDMAMKWVNFIIFVAVIVKYAREPIKAFLKQQKGDVVAEIDKLEAEKQRIIGEIEAAKLQATENKIRHKELKERLIAQGELRKQQIVDQARQQGTIMIDETRKKMETRILQAKDKLKMELADMAFNQALQQLPQIITDDDNQHLLDIYMRGMHLEQEVLS
jgi:F-type H+-transporting ATPase subunit b